MQGKEVKYSNTCFSGCQPETAVSRIKGGVFLFREEMNREEQETSAGESAKEASRGGA